MERLIPEVNYSIKRITRSHDSSAHRVVFTFNKFGAKSNAITRATEMLIISCALLNYIIEAARFVKKKTSNRLYTIHGSPRASVNCKAAVGLLSDLSEQRLTLAGRYHLIAFYLGRTCADGCRRCVREGSSVVVADASRFIGGSPARFRRRKITDTAAIQETRCCKCIRCTCYALSAYDSASSVERYSNNIRFGQQ